jgi:collagenase-like PrtC family protease
VKFSVATNFAPDLAEALEGYPVQELFGKLSADRIGGGRASFMLERTGKSRFRRHVAELAARGIGFNYLLNPACLDNREYTRQGQKDLEEIVEFVESCGISSVTISLPFLLPLIKRRYPRLKVRVGVFARVDCVEKARFWEGLGADCITLESFTVNRNLDLLRRIRDSVGVELQLIANCNCLMFCPMSGEHMVNLSHASQRGHATGGFMIDYCALRCSWMKLAEPSRFLRSEFIRPEDMELYRSLGYDSFKILERGAPTPVLAERVRAYAEGRYDGNLLNLIQPYGYWKESPATSRRGRASSFLKFFCRPGMASLKQMMPLKRLAEERGLTAPSCGDPVWIENRALDGFLSGMQSIDCRGTDCSACGYCGRWARRAVRIDEEFRTRMLQMYEENFERMHSGRFWGLGC